MHVAYYWSKVENEENDEEDDEEDIDDDSDDEEDILNNSKNKMDKNVHFGEEVNTIFGCFNLRTGFFVRAQLHIIMTVIIVVSDYNIGFDAIFYSFGVMI